MISVTGLRFSYDPGFAPEVLSGIDLTIGEGEFVGIVGRNGSGKSSLARAFNGLNQPTAGTVLVDGLSTGSAADLPAIRRAVQLVFQNPENQQVGLTVFEDIAFGLSNFGIPSDRMPDIARRALELVGLDVDLDRDVTRLAGGELQRLALAGVLALEPSYLVLDEATAMLDPVARSTFLSALGHVREDRGFSVIHITHHVDEVVGADRLVAIRDGRVEAIGSPGELIGNHALLERCGVEPLRKLSRPAVRPSRGGDAIETVDLTVAYREKRQRTIPTTFALDGISLTVGAGELLAIAGPSGAGKSTLVSALKGLIKPARGSISIDGVDPWAAKNLAAFDSVGYAFQFPEHQLFAHTVRDDVGFALKGLRLSPAVIEQRVAAALTLVGLDPHAFLERSPFDLSGGEQRRAALAGVIVGSPQILVLDEPTAGLDFPSRTALFALIDDLRSTGTTVIWVSHRLDEIFEHADRVVVVKAGRVEIEGDPALVFSGLAEETAA